MQQYLSSGTLKTEARPAMPWSCSTDEQRNMNKVEIRRKSTPSDTDARSDPIMLALHRTHSPHRLARRRPLVSATRSWLERIFWVGKQINDHGGLGRSSEQLAGETHSPDHATNFSVKYAGRMNDAETTHVMCIKKLQEEGQARSKRRYQRTSARLRSSSTHLRAPYPCVLSLFRDSLRFESRKAAVTKRNEDLHQQHGPLVRPCLRRWPSRSRHGL